MDESVLVLLRFGAYVLNIFLFLTVILRYKHHTPLVGLVLVLVVSAVAVLLRYLGRFESYLALLDYVVTPLLYLNAFLILWMLIKHHGPPDDK